MNEWRDCVSMAEVRRREHLIKEAQAAKPTLKVELCDDDSHPKAFFCRLSKGHAGKHKAYSGSEEW